jgi:hypothetical protein
MKKVLFTIFALLLVSSFAFGQWTYVKDWAKGTQPHGIVMDPDGKIWVGFYSYTDTVLTAQGKELPVSPIWVYDNVNDTEPEEALYFTFEDGTVDTLDSYCRGLSLDQNGNIMFSGNQILYRINYQTKELMDSYKYPVSGSVTEAAVDSNGFTYLVRVVGGGNPVVILDEDFELYSYVIDSCKTIQRSILVSPDGKDVYLGTIYAGINGARHYRSEDGPDGEYTLVDTLGATLEKAMWAQCLDWDQWGNMWVGSYWDVASPTDYNGWYALDPKNDWAIADSIGHSFGKFVKGVPAEGGTYYSPRGLIIWPEDNTFWALTNDFDGGVVKLWQNASPYTGVITVKNGKVARDFSLKQNYPNPFNPTTTIPFTLDQNSHVELVIFDMMGREVRTVVSENMAQGNHEVTFDAAGLASGNYFYRLNINGQMVTKSMTLLK